MSTILPTPVNPEESLSPAYQLDIEKIETHSLETLLTHRHGIPIEKTAGVEFGFYTTGEEAFSSGSDVTGMVRIITPEQRNAKLTLDEAHPLYKTEMAPLVDRFHASESPITAARSVTVDAARVGRTTLPLKTSSRAQSGRLENVIGALRKCETEIYVQVVLIPCSRDLGNFLAGDGREKYADQHPETELTDHVALGIHVAGKPTGDGHVTGDVGDVTEAATPPTKKSHPHTLKRVSRNPTRATTYLETPELRPAPTRLWWLTAYLAKHTPPLSTKLQHYSPIHLGVPPKLIITSAESEWYLGKSTE